jgi:hypothetical protein
MLFLSTITTVLATGILSVAADYATSSRDPIFQNGKYIVESGVAEFSHKRHWDFKRGQLAKAGKLPKGLHANSDRIGNPPHVHKFSTNNVAVTNGFLTLTVPGGQSKRSAISSAEVETDVGNILYASVRTTAILSKSPGVCNGMFRPILVS